MFVWDTNYYPAATNPRLNATHLWIWAFKSNLSWHYKTVNLYNIAIKKVKYLELILAIMQSDKVETAHSFSIKTKRVWKIKKFVRQILFTRVVIIYWTGNGKLPDQSCPSFHPETFQFLQIFSRFITCKNWYERIPKLFKELYHWFE